MKKPMLLTTIFVIMAYISNASSFSESGMSEMEWDIDRQGSDIDKDGFDLPTSDPTLCQEACYGEPKCSSWAYVKPNTVKGPRPKCFLKDAVPEAKPNPACVSGRKLSVVELKP